MLPALFDEDAHRGLLVALHEQLESLCNDLPRPQLTLSWSAAQCRLSGYRISPCLKVTTDASRATVIVLALCDHFVEDLLESCTAGCTCFACKTMTLLVPVALGAAALPVATSA